MMQISDRPTMIERVLGAIQKVRHRPRGGGGSSKIVTNSEKGGGGQAKQCCHSFQYFSTFTLHKI